MTRTYRWSGLAAVAVLALAGCRTGVNHVQRDPYYKTPPVAPREASIEAMHVDGSDASAQIAESDLVFNGEVIEVGRPPRAGSGTVVATQPVAFRVTKVLKGVETADRVVVHFVVADGATIDPAASNRLDAAIFYEGARLLVWAQRVDEGTPRARWLHPWTTPGPVAAEGHAATRLRTRLR